MTVDSKLKFISLQSQCYAIVDILILENKILNISLISSITVEEFIYFFCDHTVPIKNNLLTKQLDQNSLYTTAALNVPM